MNNRDNELIQDEDFFHVKDTITWYIPDNDLMTALYLPSTSSKSLSLISFRVRHTGGDALLERIFRTCYIR